MQRRIGWLTFTAMALNGALACGADHVDFNRQVRPILAAHCFKCHGPDENAREAGLQLDVREVAVGKLESESTAITPGKPEASELIRRIFSADADARMPPPSADKALSTAQKQILRQWIAEGAAYEPHWAFMPPKQAPLPSLKNAAWPRNAIDHFVLARIEAAGLSPSPPADKYTLVRRLYLDLIGLPPTPAEADAFVNDSSPNAYERVVDRLLRSPHYGERWARRWLDLARYADTNGYEKDRPRSMWPYRDWVIDAINADMPFDQFTIEQLAGDMLPGASPSQRIATGFHRNTMINEEGGIDPLEFRYYSVVDRINTTATVWLGLTLGCAQCHTHKFDPIPHQDYYRMLALVNNADEPEVEVPQADVSKRRAEIKQQIAALETDLANRFPPDGEGANATPGPEHLKKKFESWLKAQSEQAAKWTLLKTTSATSVVPTLTILDDGSVISSGDQTKRDQFDLVYDTVGMGRITAIRLEAMPDERLPKGGPGRIYYEGPPGDFWLSELTLLAGGKPAKVAAAFESCAGGKNSAAGAIDGNPQTAWSINGGQGKLHWATFQLENPLDAPQIQVKLLFERYYAANLGRFRVWATDAAGASQAKDLPTDIANLLAVPEADRSAQQNKALLDHFLATAPELAAAREEIAKLRKELPAQPTTLVLSERPADHPRATHRHHRGEFLDPREPANPGTLSILPALPKDAPPDRLTFARWLVSPANPLVGRVTMNRQWAAFFGSGIVRTTEDFGYQGEPPTHPELLDWLAVELMNQGWSLKRMHKLIVMSATYQQSSVVQPEHLRLDPQNKLLARMPRLRFDAETVRDSVLKVSGLLSHKLGGPSVFPPQPPGITSEGTYGPLAWNVSQGDDRYRRGLYTFAKRTAPYAMFQTFDGPSGEACVARREVSNTPLQALTLLNDAVLVEAAQTLGKSSSVDKGSVDERMTALFRRCLVRPPTADEVSRLNRFYSDQLDRLKQKQLDAAAITGNADGGEASDKIMEQAAWTLVARAILNLDEAITKE